MGLAATWIVLALVCAVFVLVIAGRTLIDPLDEDARPESGWRAFTADFFSWLAPLGMRIEIMFLRLGRRMGLPAKRLEDLSVRLDEIAHERRQIRDIAKMADLGDSDLSNMSLDDFLQATQTSEPAYADVEPISEKLEEFYESLQERRAVARARR